MLKIRLQGTTNELKWFRKILEKNSNFEILSISEPYANKGTNKYFSCVCRRRKNQTLGGKVMCRVIAIAKSER